MTLFSRLFKLFILVIVTPLFATAVFLFYYQSHNKKEILAGYYNVAQIAARFLQQNVEDISLRFSFIDDITKKDSQFTEDMARFRLDEARATNPDFIFLALLDAQGKEYLRSAPQDVSSVINAIDLSADAALKNLQPRQIALSDISGEALPIPVVEVVYPSQDGKFLFALINVYGIWDKLTTRKGSPQDMALYFADSSGKILNYNDTPAPALDERAVALTLKDDSRFITGLKTESGKKLVGAWAKSPLPDTYVLVLQDKKEAYRTINLISWLIAFFVFATTTLSYFAALSFSQEVSEPVEALTKAAQKISQNDFDVNINSQSYQEDFGILIDAFNSMAKRLSEYQAVQLDRLLDEKKKNDLLARLMRDGLIMCTLEGESLFMNKMAQDILESGSLSEDLEKTVISEETPEELVQSNLKDLMKTPEGSVLKHRQDNGSKRYFEVVNEIFRPAKEAPVAIIVLRDITEEYKTNEMKNNIFNAVAHDLRAPLLGLQAYLMVLEDGKISGEKEQFAKTLQAMNTSVTTLTGLVENILDISKLERGVLQLNRKDFDLSSVCARVLQTLLPLAQRKNIYAKNNIPQDVIIFGDEFLIAQVFSNLISNAIKFTDEGGIEINYSRDDKYHIISVKDSGLGIKQDELKKIFEKYHQSDIKVKGYGMGLTIARQIIWAHKGTIEAQSEGKNKGSQIIFTLPLEAAEGVSEISGADIPEEDETRDGGTEAEK